MMHEVTSDARSDLVARLFDARSNLVIRLFDVCVGRGGVVVQSLGGSKVEILVDNLHVMELLKNDSLLGFGAVQTQLYPIEMLSDEAEVGGKIGRVDDCWNLALRLRQYEYGRLAQYVQGDWLRLLSRAPAGRAQPL